MQNTDRLNIGVDNNTDEEAEEMLKDKEKIRELAFQWSDEHIFVEARKLEESEVQEL